MFLNPLPASCVNLTGPKANILVNNSGHACLADFSLLTIASDRSTIVTSCAEGGTIPWMSPELLDPDRFGSKKSRPTKESDCYAMGMVTYEVLSGQTPFSPAIPSAIIWKILDGQHPWRPQGEKRKLFTDAIWRLLELCWRPQPSERPSAGCILSCLEGNPPSTWWTPNVDGRMNGGHQLDDAPGNSGMHSHFTSATPLIICVVCKVHPCHSHC